MDYDIWLIRDMDEHPEKYKKGRRDYLFRLFKRAKHILNGLEDYPVSDTVKLSRRDGAVILDYIKDIKSLREIEIVAAEGETQRTVAGNGFFAHECGYGVTMAIVDCDEIQTEFLDESSVRGLLLSERVSTIQNDGLYQFLRYIYVKESNPYFRSESDVLYSKDGTKLYAYAAYRPGKEYTVGPEVKHISYDAFSGIEYLKRLILPATLRGTELIFCEGYRPEIVYYKV